MERQMILLETRYNPLLVVLSFLIAIFASYVALDLANSVARAKGRQRLLWLICGAIAMGFGIWSMHFVGMLAFSMPGVPMAYDVALMMLSIAIAVAASALALFIVAQREVSRTSLVSGGIAMAAAIAGMHYTGMFSMRMPARIYWNPYWVITSVLIALFASFVALRIAMRLRGRPSGSRLQFVAAIVMGIAICGMHYTGMWAATFVYDEGKFREGARLLATSELGIAVLLATAFILGVALVSSLLDRAFRRREQKTVETTRRYREASTAVSRLREEQDLRDRFVSALAHDLRTPLAAAKISTQLAMRRSTSPEEVERLCGRVQDNLRRADQMIQNLLDAHRISAGQALPIKRERSALRPVLEKSFEDLATIHGERFILECDPELAGTFDPNYLQRAVENLCANAVKYGQDGSKILVRASQGPGALVISVKNNGHPISPEDQKNLFNLFHRGQAAESGGKRGWGLGLTIVKGIAEAHGGRVRVESGAEGTVFEIVLPDGTEAHALNAASGDTFHS